MVRSTLGWGKVVVFDLRPKRGGFLRPFGCGQFIRDFLSGDGPHGSPAIDPIGGACQADIFRYYKTALMTATAFEKATRIEEQLARQPKRDIDPENIQVIGEKLLADMPYKAHGCRYHSFVTYFSMLQKLGWVEPTGALEASSFQSNYPLGQPRKYFRLTLLGKAASDQAWANPHAALYGN